MKKLFNMREEKREDILLRLYGLNVLLNVIFYFIVDSLNNINEILLFNLLTIGSIELLLSERNIGLSIFRGLMYFLFTFISALIIYTVLSFSISFIFKEKGIKFIESLNIYPANKTIMTPFFKSKKVTKQKSKYSEYSIDEDLFMQLALLQGKDIEKANEDKSYDIALLPSMYTDMHSKRLYCAMMQDVTKINKDDPDFTKLDFKIKTECPIYNEIYEKYNYMFISAVISKKIPIFYYFRASEGESIEDVGMFPTAEECKHYANLFREKEISLVGKCKKYNE